MIKKTRRFLKEVVLELKKVSWSTRQEIIGSTIAVIILVAMLAIFIGTCDIVLSKLVGLVIRRTL